MKKNLLDGIKNIYVAITHRHSDHVGSLGDLVAYCYYILKITVNIYDGAGHLSGYLLECGVTSNQWKEFVDGIPEMDLKLKSYHASHVELYQNSSGEISNIYNESDNPKKLFSCYSYEIYSQKKKIFYSGDCSHIDFNKHRDCDGYYIDTCIADHPGNAHYNIELLYKDCRDANIDIQKVWCMHIDNDRLIARAEELGFNVAEID